MPEIPKANGEKPEPVPTKPVIGTNPSQLPAGEEPEVLSVDPLVGLEGGPTLKESANEN